MWLVYISLLLCVLALIMLIWSGIKSVKGMIVTVKHLSVVAEKAREQGEAVQRQQEQLLNTVQGMTTDVSKKVAIITDVLYEGKQFIQIFQKLKLDTVEKLNTLK